MFSVTLDRVDFLPQNTCVFLSVQVELFTLVLIWTPSGQELCRSEIYKRYKWIPPQYWSWHLTLCCCLEAQNLTQSVKESSGQELWVWNFTGDINGPHNNIEVDIWHSAAGLRRRIPPSQLKSQVGKNLAVRNFTGDTISYVRSFP